MKNSSVLAMVQSSTAAGSRKSLPESAQAYRATYQDRPERQEPARPRVKMCVQICVARQMASVCVPQNIVGIPLSQELWPSWVLLSVCRVSRRTSRIVGRSAPSTDRLDSRRWAQWTRGGPHEQTISHSISTSAAKVLICSTRSRTSAKYCNRLLDQSQYGAKNSR